ncbi:elongation factor P [Planctomyces sp. SH-PL14]|jgi:elongation factor P|uniref:elongation factor P n=1 Tax=Planctomyces sp. SH-PL14 TaxID=1632864 RepID=UPI00078C13B4|nr:elongation factor P [Planctomyces sp. SH-PL14]AMV17102.1 Elongation factor P [Planctomyces sp. SH-PL14]
MAQINAGDFRKGIKVIIEGKPYDMVSCEFVKPGKGQALYRTRNRNLLTGQVLEITYRSGDSLEAADVRTNDGMYSYFDGSNYIFMDNDSFEQVGLSAAVCADQMKYIKDATPCSLLYWNEQLIGVTPPQHIILEVTYSEPAARGNTANNVTKGATVETGGDIQVPAFINAGDKIKIDTATGEYLGRVNS